MTIPPSQIAYFGSRGCPKGFGIMWNENDSLPISWSSRESGGMRHRLLTHYDIYLMPIGSLVSTRKGYDRRRKFAKFTGGSATQEGRRWLSVPLPCCWL